jgi:hypothetical protein
MSLWVIAFVAAMTLGVWLLGWRLIEIKSRERIYCDTEDGIFMVDFQRRANAEWEAGPRVGVTRCTAFADPEHVTCDKSCVYLS